jgi:hypothetical protein
MNLVKLSLEHIGEFLFVSGIPAMRGGASLEGRVRRDGEEGQKRKHLEFTLEKVVVDIEGAPFAVEVVL